MIQLLEISRTLRWYPKNCPTGLLGGGRSCTERVPPNHVSTQTRSLIAREQRRRRWTEDTVLNAKDCHLFGAEMPGLRSFTFGGRFGVHLIQCEPYKNLRTDDLEPILVAESTPYLCVFRVNQASGCRPTSQNLLPVCCQLKP